MKKRWVLIAALFAGPACAEWIKVDSTETSFVYLDPQTVRKDGARRRVWSLQDLKSRDKDGELSRRIQLEFDCKNETSRSLHFSTHSGNMAAGSVLFRAEGSGKWLPVPPDTPYETMMSAVCGS